LHFVGAAFAPTETTKEPRRIGHLIATLNAESAIPRRPSDDAARVERRRADQHTSFGG
jgi:hypothetical protein